MGPYFATQDRRALYLFLLFYDSRTHFSTPCFLIMQFLGESLSPSNSKEDETHSSHMGFLYGKYTCGHGPSRTMKALPPNVDFFFVSNLGTQSRKCSVFFPDGGLLFLLTLLERGRLFSVTKTSAQNYFEIPFLPLLINVN